MRIAVKIVGTLGVTVLLAQPLWAPQWGRGLLGEIAVFPPPVALAVVAGFLGLVALYCRALQRALALVGPRPGVAAPASVWWMFAIPYNFVEDFFIVHAVATGLRREGSTPAPALRRLSALGYGWCALQILSLLPGAPGYAGGAVAVPLWLAHWALTLRVNRRLAAHTSIGIDR